MQFCAIGFVGSLSAISHSGFCRLMAVCEKIRAKRRRVCIADLDRLITVQNRSIQTPTDTDDYTELFAAESVSSGGMATGNVWAMIESTAGKTVFDTTGVERVVSHKITTRYLSGITAESWVLFNGNRYDVVSVENLDERDEFSVMRCVFRGVSTSSVNAQ